MTASSKQLEPMEARSADTIPVGEQWQYEPKWDGFRCLLERAGNTILMRSKSGQDLSRYFPEVAASAISFPETDFILDGELVIQLGDEFSFDALLQRIHPAASRIVRLAAETPAQFLAFDILKRRGIDLTASLSASIFLTKAAIEMGCKRSNVIGVPIVSLAGSAMASVQLQIEKCSVRFC
jgi:ATP-dependent DNA ligase